jgi:hypothetical protein
MTTDGHARDLARHLGTAPAAALVRWASSINAAVEVTVPVWKATGYTGGIVLAVVVTRPPGPPIKLLAKYCPPGPYAHEPQRHHLAVQVSPPGFVDAHLVRPFFDPIPVGDGYVLLQDIAGGSLLDYQPMSGLSPSELAPACRAVVDTVVRTWNGPDIRTQVATVAAFLTAEMRDTFAPGGSVRRWGSRRGLLKDGRLWLSFPGAPDEVLPNPMTMAEPDHPLLRTTEIMSLVGRTHGDLHLDNVVVRRRPARDPRDLQLVDLTTFEPSASLTRDPAMLLLAVVARALPDLPTDQRHALRRLITSTGGADDVSLVPPYLAATVVAVTEAGRAAVLPNRLDAEWDAQFLLSLQAVALLHTTFDSVPPDDRCWFLLLAATAGAEFMRRRGLCQPGEPWSITCDDVAAPQPAAASRDPAPSSGATEPGYSGMIKLQVCWGMGASWRDLADVLGVPRHERDRFAAGYEAQELWEWLAARGRIGDLRGGLRLIGRDDLLPYLDGS